MKTSLLDTVLKKYRIDGDVKSPIRFLTIEDGGEDFSDGQEFLQYYTRPDDMFTWLPEPNEDSTKHVGLPGQYIAKVMSELLRKLDVCDVDWRTYRRDKIYRKYEHNIKYLPIGRKTVSSYPEWMHEILGVSKTGYEELARITRKEVFEKLFSVQPAKTTIVFGYLPEWLEVFNSLYPELTVESMDNHLKLAFINSEKRKLAFAYFPHFKWLAGSKNQRASDLVDMLVSQIELEKIVI